MEDQQDMQVDELVVVDGECKSVKADQKVTFSDSAYCLEHSLATKEAQGYKLRSHQTMSDQSVRTFSGSWNSDERSHLLTFETIMPDGTGTSSAIILGEQPKPVVTDARTLKEQISAIWNAKSKPE